VREVDVLRATFGRSAWPVVQDLPQLQAHGLAAFVYASMARSDTLSHQPRRDALRLAVMANLHTEQQRQPHLLDVLRTLRGIPVIALKGLDYAHRLYRDPAERPMGDHDLLVPAKHYEQALARLLEKGFASAIVQQGVAALPLHYAAQLVRDGYHLDLHRSLRQVQRTTIDYDAIFSRATASDLMGEPVLFLDPVDRILLHVYHQAAHEFCVPLITFVDLELMLTESPALITRAKAFGISRALNHALFLRDQLFRFVGHPPVSRLLPTMEEVITQTRPSRALQLLRKALLFDSVRSLAQFSRYAAGALS
jgi:hypothetical protein